MLELLACLSEREVLIADQAFRVRPPTVIEALRVTAALQAFGRGDVEAWNALEETCRKWLPEGLCAIYFGDEAYPAGTLKDVQELLAVGVIDRAEHEAKKSNVEAEAKERSWFDIATDYADVLNTPLMDVLAMPFPLFIGCSRSIFRIQAGRQADVMIASAAGRNGGDLWKAIIDAAGYGKPKPIVHEPDPEFVKRQKEKALRYHQLHGKPGKA